MADFLPLAGRLLPTSAAPYELAGLAALLEVMPIDHSAASTIWDPRTCPAHVLPALAYALSVDLWRDDWDELKKRSVIAASPELHDLKTSIAGYRRYLDIVDARLIDYVAPPKGFVAGAVLSDDQRREWLRALPELRLYTGAEMGAFDAGFYEGLGFSDITPALADRGRALSARKARIWDPATGVETQIGPVDFDRITAGDTTIDLERIALPGPFDGLAFHADISFVDVAFAVPTRTEAAPVFTWRIETTGQNEGRSVLDALPLGLQPINALPERVPLRRVTDQTFFADVSFSDIAFVGDQSAALGFYDAYKIARVGERSGTPLVDAGGFADLDYVSWAAHTLHLLVDVSAPTGSESFFADISFSDRAYAVMDDLSRFDDALRAAYVASGPGSDHVTIDTEVTRLLTLSDGIPLDGSFRFGQRVPRARA